jgi:hypothetical protein
VGLLCGRKRSFPRLPDDFFRPMPVFFSRAIGPARGFPQQLRYALHSSLICFRLHGGKIAACRLRHQLLSQSVARNVVILSRFLELEQCRIQRSPIGIGIRSKTLNQPDALRKPVERLTVSLPFTSNVIHTN